MIVIGFVLVFRGIIQYSPSAVDYRDPSYAQLMFARMFVVQT